MRLDHYKKIGNNNIHLAAILYNLMIIGVLVLAIATVLASSLKRELASIELFNIRRRQIRQERRAGQSKAEDELSLNRTKVEFETSDIAWKKLQGDVFRKPDLPALLSTLLGMGVQCGFMTYICVFALLIGLMHPNLRYFNFLNAFFMLSLGGFLNGYVTATMMRFFGASDWKLAASSSALILPISIVLVILMVDLIEYFEKAN